MVTQAPDGSIEFRFFRPDAKQVLVAGDFSCWDRAPLAMLRDPAGWWHCRMMLKAGVYQFRYVADGVWFTDHAAFGIEQGPFGWNAVLKVDAPRPTVETADRQAA